MSFAGTDKFHQVLAGLPADARALLQLEPALGSDPLLRLVVHGTWGHHPLAIGPDGRMVALRVSPSSSAEGWPVTIVAGADATTFAEKPASFLPLWLYELHLNGKPADEWSVFSSALNQVGAALEDAHLALGGSASQWEALENLAADRDLAERSARTNTDAPMRFVYLQAVALERLAVSGELARHIQWCRQGYDDDEENWNTWPGAIPETGPFAPSTLACAFIVAMRLKRPELGPVAWQRWGLAASLDSAKLISASILPMPLGHHLRRAPGQRLARFVVAPETELPDEANDHPLLACARAVVTERDQYNGLAHVEAAAMLDEEFDDPVASFDALQSAAYWSCRRYGFPIPSILDAALMLSHKRGWDAVAEHLEVVAAARPDADG